MKTAFAILACLPCAAMAGEACSIIDDTVAVYEVRERSFPLAQYEQVFVRAASGKIRCEEDSKYARYVCNVEGEGEIFVEGGDRAPHVIQFLTADMGEAHIYPMGDLSCGLKSDFN